MPRKTGDLTVFYCGLLPNFWQDLLDIVKEIDSKMLFPIHTEHPDAYKKVTDKITIVEEAKRYEI